MQHPYGPGLLLAPDGFRPKLEWALDRAWRAATRIFLKAFVLFGLERLRVSELIWVKDRMGREVRNYRLLHPSQSVDIALPGDAAFLKSCKHYGSGIVELGEVFVCELSNANYYPSLGVVANESFKVFGDSVLLPHRFHLSRLYCSVRPLRPTYHAGPVSSIQRIDTYNFWHWMADCLPQLLTLEEYMNGEPLTLLMSDDLGSFQRETLDYMLPSTMKVKYVPGNTWIRTDRFILPSYLSGRCNGYLPSDYYSEIRRRITHGLDLPETGEPTLRVYLSRAGARRRRVANEDAIVESLRGYGFIAVRPETLSIREQVSLFQRAEVIVGPHGAALGAMVFSPRAKLLVLYPERHPGEYFYTMARRIGIDHVGLVHDSEADEDSAEDFVVDQARMEALLLQMGVGKRETDPSQIDTGPLSVHPITYT